MSRDHRKLRVFTLADDLVTLIYRSTEDFPLTERFGLRTQLRHAAVSVSCNVVEGSARRTTRDYLNFLNVAVGSASEARYLAERSGRLGYLSDDKAELLTTGYSELSARLNALIQP